MNWGSHYSPCVNGSQISNHPFGGIESENADRVKALQSEPDESLGADAHVVKVLLIRPCHPLKVHWPLHLVQL